MYVSHVWERTNTHVGAEKQRIIGMICNIILWLYGNGVTTIFVLLSIDFTQDDVNTALLHLWRIVSVALWQYINLLLSITAITRQSTQILWYFFCKIQWPCYNLHADARYVLSVVSSVFHWWLSLILFHDVCNIFSISVLRPTNPPWESTQWGSTLWMAVLK